MWIGSPVCFILASYNYPGAIRATFGRRAEDISDEVWDELEGPGAGAEDRLGLGTMLKMTRCHDLGLAQLLFPGAEWVDGGEDEDAQEDAESGSEWESDGSDAGPLELVERN